MIQPRVVRIYAKALFDAASRENLVDQVESDLGLVSYVSEISPRLVESLRSPVVPDKTKHAIIDDVFAVRVNQITLDYLHLLVDKRREEALAATEDEYIRLANEARGIVLARVTTAVELDAAEEARLIAKLGEVTGKIVQLEKLIDSGLIGGVTVRIGDTVIDGSIKGRLEAIRESLIS